ncbi:hypothetical protein F5Y10DRAFT_36014 [Nemania abortiva]|nr:hypothetical protein F5Y10DRAFT_36014 [Nemania abortiva]
MAPIHNTDRGIDRQRVLERLEYLYQDPIIDDDSYERVAANIGRSSSAAMNPKTHSPSTTIPQMLSYLRDNDADRDANWDTNFAIICHYIAEAHRAMLMGELGFSDPRTRAALEDARVMIQVHLKSEQRAREKTLWTDDILRGQTTQQRLLTYPKVFPLPDPDRAKSKYRPVKPMPRPNNDLPLWGERLPKLAEIDDYVRGENKFFKAAQRSAKTGGTTTPTGKRGRFSTENQAYERYISRGVAETSAKAPLPHGDGAKDHTYKRRGWQRAALQQCLNLFTNHENRAINTPWRRPVLPYDPPAPLPKEIPYVPRVAEPNQVGEKEKEPFSWLHWSSEYTRIVDFLADCQRQRYVNQSWSDLSASALPVNFRGPRIYRGLAIHDQYWLKVGEYLDNLESMLHSAWGAAPRPLLRAILRDIDAGRRNTPAPPKIGSSEAAPAVSDDELQDRKRYWRRDIKRRLGIDNVEGDADSDTFKLLDGFESGWLTYLCEPSRTLEMCDPSKQPTRNLLILFDTKLQSYFRNLPVSGTPDSKALNIWAEDREDVEDVMHYHKPNTLLKIVAYINGCTEAEVKDSGDTDPNPEHPNGSYQFSLEEAEFLCAELHALGRCVYMPERGNELSKVDRPRYNVHPEDRVLWRYADSDEFAQSKADYVNDIVDHYDNSYGNWSQYIGERPRFSREIEYMMDHAGPDFTPELERIETQYEHPGTKEAFAKRRSFIKRYIVSEGLCHIADPAMDNIEGERAAPYRDDLATWELTGAYLTEYHKQQKQQHGHINYHFSGEPYEPQTPERSVQFFRNIAYRMGRTLNYVDQIRERLHYLEPRTQDTPSKPPLDLSTDLKEPRPEINTNANAAQAPAAVEKWWQPVSIKDYNLAIEKWSTAIREGSGEVALLPPDVRDVLLGADPDSSFQNPLKGVQDPFTVIREGIIDDCFQNRPTMYLGRLSGLKDQEDKEYQGYQRPSLFDWATKDQRRYQAQHTRRHFFNMQRWPLSRILPHRLEAIQKRKDEVARTDPSKPDQAYGILTHRLPVGKDKPLYAHPIIDHGHGPDDWRDIDLDFANPPSLRTRPRDPITESQDQNPAPQDQTQTPTPKNQVTGTQGLITPPQTITPRPRVQYEDEDEAGDLFDEEDGDLTNVKANRNGNANNANTNLGNNPTIPIPNQNITGGNNPTTPIPNQNATGGNISSNINGDNSNAMAMETQTMKPQGLTQRLGDRSTGRLIPVRRSDEKFAPGPAVFPMGDTLLQKVLISHELSNALYPTRPFYRDRLLGLPKLWQKLVGAEPPMVPLVPPVAKANIPRSNPRKRKMPIEFLNGASAAKKFRSDVSGPLIPGGVGGQFAGGVVPQEDTTGQQQQPTGSTGVTGGKGKKRDRDYSEGAYTYDPQTGRLEGRSRAQSTVGGQATFHDMTTSRTIAAAGTTLKTWPETSKAEGKNRFRQDFPNGWVSTTVELDSLYPAATMALEFSINSQLRQHNLQATQKELSALAKSLPALQSYVDTRHNNFDIHALAHLLEVYGENHGLNLQLGIVQQEQNNGTNPYIIAGPTRAFGTYLVGGKYDLYTDKIVVWVRLERIQRHSAQLINGYNKEGYSCYKGISARGKK